MIQNDDQLKVVRNQLWRAEDGLAALRREMRGQNAAQFELFAEPHLEMIRRLRAEIDAYLGISNGNGSINSAESAVEGTGSLKPPSEVG